MTLKLYFDSETTGFKNALPLEWALALIGPEDQDVWLGHGLVNLSTIPGVFVEAGAASVHHITLEMCKEQGIAPGAMTALFTEFVSKADMFVGYNPSYDLDVMRRLYARVGVSFPELPRVVDLSNWAERLCQLPASGKMLKYGRYGFKRPSLSEAMRILCPSYDYQPHRAMPDVQACRILHRTMKEILDGQKAAATNTSETSADNTAEQHRPAERGDLAPEQGDGNPGVVQA